MRIEEAAALVDEIGGGRCDLFRVGVEFGSHERNTGGQAAEALLVALKLWFCPRGDAKPETYKPFTSPAGTRGAATQKIVEAWQEVVLLVRSPAIRGRLHDLLWIERFGDKPYEHARMAVECYVSGARLGFDRIHDDTLILERASELAQEINAHDLFASIAEQADAGLAIELRRPEGERREDDIVRRLQLLSGILGRAHLRARLREARQLLAGSHPHDREDLIELEMQLAIGDGDELRLEAANMWIDWASQQRDGLQRGHALRMALEYANNMSAAGDLQKNIRRQIEEIEADDLNLGSISIGVDVPVAALDELVTFIAGEDGIEAALKRFGTWSPPTGDPKANADAAAERMTMPESVLTALMPFTIIDQQGRPIRRYETEDEKLALAVRQRETSSAVLHSVLAVCVLDGIGERYAPEQAELGALFETEFIDHGRADAFARAFRHYWAGRIDEAVHVALPRIEETVRRILVAEGGVAYHEPEGGRAGREKTLGAILHELRSFADEGWQRYLSVVLTEPEGLNLRNRYLHGQIEDASKEDAALILQIAARLRLAATISSGAEAGQPR